MCMMMTMMIDGGRFFLQDFYFKTVPKTLFLQNAINGSLGYAILRFLCVRMHSCNRYLTKNDKCLPAL